MKTGVIYCIENKINDKRYIGQTIDYKRRKRQHLNALKSNKHYNKHLQRSFNKYGKENFIIYILSKVKLNIISLEEKKWIAYYKTFKTRGYNMTVGGEELSGKSNPFYGKKHNLKTKEKMSKSLSGKNNPMYNKHYGGLKGEKNPRCKLKKEKCIEIYKEYHKTKKMQKTLAKKYNVSSMTISLIVNKKHWATRNIKE